MDRTGTAAEVAKKISELLVNREYSQLDLIIEGIFTRNDKLEFLIELARRISANSFHFLCLRGLTHLMGLSDSDFQRLFDLASAHDKALYGLTGFLLIHGNAKPSALRRLCENFEKIAKEETFKARLEAGGPTPNDQRMNAAIYEQLSVPIDLLSRFRARFAQ